MSLERILDDLSKEVGRLLFRVGGLQANPIESLETDGALMTPSQGLQGHQDILMEVVEHLLLQLLYQARVRSVVDGEITVKTPHPPLCLYLSPAVPHTGHRQAHHQHHSSQQSQDDSVRKVIFFSLSLSLSLVYTYVVWKCGPPETFGNISLN